MATRDYSLLGPDGARAVETGLAAAEWYHTDLPRKMMKELMQRSDGPATPVGKHGASALLRGREAGANGES